MLLAACSSSGPAIQYRPVEKPPVDGALLVCADAPSSPIAVEAMTQRDIAALLIQTAAAWLDCKGKLGTVAEQLKPVPLPPGSLAQ